MRFSTSCRAISFRSLEATKARAIRRTFAGAACFRPATRAPPWVRRAWLVFCWADVFFAAFFFRACVLCAEG